MADLRAMGEGNAVLQRLKRPTRRTVLAHAAALYAARYGAEGGRITATFQVLFLTGWRPMIPAKPQRRGSAKARLADVLGTVEGSTGRRPVGAFAGDAVADRRCGPSQIDDLIAGRGDAGRKSFTSLGPDENAFAGRQGSGLSRRLHGHIDVARRGDSNWVSPLFGATRIEILASCSTRSALGVAKEIAPSGKSPLTQRKAPPDTRSRALPPSVPSA